MSNIGYKNIRLGDILQELGYVSGEQIQKALQYQKEHSGVLIGDALIELNYLTESQMLEALGKRFSMHTVAVDDLKVDLEAVKRVPRGMAEQNNVLAYRKNNEELYVATNDPTNFYALEDIRQSTGMFLKISLSDKLSLQKAINYYYSEIDAQRAAEQVNEAFEQAVESVQAEDADDTPIINLVDSLVNRAYNIGASDIHIEPFEEKTIIRMRVDGIITDYVTLNKSIHSSVIARIKIMGDMDIAEKRVPQDGHFRQLIAGDKVNVRVSMIPTVFGEKAVLRLLLTGATIDNDTMFGMHEDDFNKFSQMLKRQNGIIYLTGPTGSGKSTTLYMVLEQLSKKKVNISTIEDPVEKNVMGINQMQVNMQSGLTFDVGLRALMRQDPDIIMVGETRDNETASISIRSAITGHVVFSTLHTNDAASSIVRLVDMGIEKYMIASSLTGIVAQRLVRKLCPYCAQEGDTTAAEREFLGEDVTRVKRPIGCNYCSNTGYQGRTAIHEILIVDHDMREMIVKGASTDELKDYAIRNGMKTLKESGKALVQEGVTSVEEIYKVAYYE